MRRDLIQAVEFSHLLFKEYIGERAVVVDATAGNGNDTAFLAELVGKEGKIFAFDIQKIAIEKTEKRLKKAGIDDEEFNSRIILINDNHQKIERYIDQPLDGIIFNLGYLPGGDQKIITEPETTLNTLKKGLKLLKEGGLVVIVVYTGHPGGSEELDLLLSYTETLDEKEYNVGRYHFINQEANPPQVLAVIKRVKN